MHFVYHDDTKKISSFGADIISHIGFMAKRFLRKKTRKIWIFLFLIQSLLLLLEVTGDPQKWWVGKKNFENWATGAIVRAFLIFRVFFRKNCFAINPKREITTSPNEHIFFLSSCSKKCIVENPKILGQTVSNQPRYEKIRNEKSAKKNFGNFEIFFS